MNATAETKTLGERIREQRILFGKSRGVLAADVGVTYQTLLNWEKNATVPRRDTGQRLLDVLPGLGEVPLPEREVPVRAPRMLSTTVYLRRDQVEDLRDLSRERTVQTAVLVREAIDLLLRQAEDKRVQDGTRGW